MRTIYIWNPQSFVIAVAQKFVLHEKFRATKRNETKQACKQTKQQQQMHANHKAPSNLLIHMDCVLCCVSSIYRFISTFKKSKTKHEQRQPKKKYWKCHRNEFTVDIRWPKTITHFTISFG